MSTHNTFLSRNKKKRYFLDEKSTLLSAMQGCNGDNLHEMSNPTF